MKLKKFVIGLALAVTTLAASAEYTWFEVAKTQNGKLVYSSAKESAHFSKSDNGTLVVVALGKVLNTEDSSVLLYQWFITTEHCRRGYGKLVSTDLAGKYIFDNDFVGDNSNIASRIAGGLCRWVDGEDKAGRSPDITKEPKGPSIPPAQIDGKSNSGKGVAL